MKESSQTPEQRRAADAWKAVMEISYGGASDDALRKRYRAYVDRLGPSILMNGLGQALAMERASAGVKPEKPDQDAHDRLYRNVGTWLCGRSGVFQPQAGQNEDILEAIIHHAEDVYLRAQVEALAWLAWHKKFCRAYLPASDGEDV